MISRRIFLSVTQVGRCFYSILGVAIPVGSVCWLFALHSPFAWAQVYKCDVAGKFEFSDRPCAGGNAKPMKLHSNSGADGVIDFHVKTRHYPVTGNNIAAAYQSLRASGPSGFAGWARWNVKYDYTSKVIGSDCMITTVTVRVDAEILMPQWIEEKEASHADQAAWRDMYNKLMRHEEGHVQHGREFALLVRERLMGIGAVPCDHLQPLAQKQYQQLYENLKNRDIEYDRRTDHGRR